MSGLSRRQFAAEIGMSVLRPKARRYRTLHLTADGKIDAPASRARIAKRRGGRRTLPNAWAAQRQPARRRRPPSGAEIDVGPPTATKPRRARRC